MFRISLVLLFVFALLAVSVPSAHACGGVSAFSGGYCNQQAVFAQSFAVQPYAVQSFAVQPYAVQAFAAPVSVFSVGHRHRAFVNAGANVQVNAVGANVRVRRGVFGGTVVRVR